MNRICAFIIKAGLAVIPVAGLAEMPFDIEELPDAAQRCSSPSWFDHVETGQRVIYGEKTDLVITVSPDERWMLFASPTEGGLDVVTYSLYLLSTDDFKIRLVSREALEGVFSPASNYVFIATGPNPVVYDLEKQVGYAISDISSGLENYPCWVAEWSGDGKELVIYQQLRFDDSASPRAWKLTLK